MGDGWNPQVSVLTSRSTSIPAVGPFMEIQRGEAGCGDVPRCDDLSPGPMRASQNGGAGCGDVPRCDDLPPGPTAENTRRGEARRGEVPQCDEPPPGPVRRCLNDLGFKKDSVRVNAAVRKRSRKVAIRTAREEEEELKIVERAILVSDAIAGFCGFH